LLSFFWVLFISSKLILQMANTRNRNANTNAKNNVENNNDAANPPPPPPPTLEQVLAMQAHMLQTIVNMQNVQPQAPPPPRETDLETFNAPRPLLSHTLWSQWMLTIGSSLWRRSSKWCVATTMRRCC
jgi:hypothetical protein